jgi:hypothetical protein
VKAVCSAKRQREIDDMIYELQCSRLSITWLILYVLSGYVDSSLLETCYQILLLAVL